MLKYLLLVSFVLSLFDLYENRELISKDVIDINDPEVRKAALFAAQAMSSENVNYELEDISEAKKIIGSDIVYKIRIVLLSNRKCAQIDSIGCKTKIFCNVSVEEQRSVEKSLKLESFGCTPMASVRRRKPSLDSTNETNA